jgi:predicted nucleotidyltransferase|tara:strand:- start:105 stop:425 length:321 start_codon:yes stop_codon:yes gene_type:complete
MTQKESIINKIQRLSDKNYPDAEIYLFGSQARGNASVSSDWDLLVLMNSDKVPFTTETKMMDEFYDIELETGQIISPLIYSKREWEDKYKITPLYNSILNEGIRIK